MCQYLSTFLVFSIAYYRNLTLLKETISAVLLTLFFLKKKPDISYQGNIQSSTGTVPPHRTITCTALKIKTAKNKKKNQKNLSKHI